MVSEKYEANPPMFRNHPIWFVVSLLLIPAFGLGLLILLVWYIKCKATKLIIENNELLWEQGILNKKRIELDTSRVRSISVNQTFVQRIFGTGDLELFTAGDSPEVVLKGMPEPMKIRSLVKGKA